LAVKAKETGEEGILDRTFVIWSELERKTQERIESKNRTPIKEPLGGNLPSLKKGNLRGKGVIWRR